MTKTLPNISLAFLRDLSDQELHDKTKTIAKQDTATQTDQLLLARTVSEPATAQAPATMP